MRNGSREQASKRDRGQRKLDGKGRRMAQVGVVEAVDLDYLFHREDSSHTGLLETVQKTYPHPQEDES